MAPSTMQQWTVTGENGFDSLKFEEVPVPAVGENEVLVKLHAASLNYRDLLITKGQYPFAVKLPVVGSSDGAGEILEVGSKVSRWKKGDKVITVFNQAHQFGPMTYEIFPTGLGGVLDGALRQYGVFNENGLVRSPTNLNYVEASTLPCAAVTSWNILYGMKSLKPGDWVLTQGTGGVSIFALQFAKAAGAKVIATTSSAAKAETLKSLGADHIINYREDKDWGKTAKNLTPGGRGCDHIVEVGGAASQEQSLAAIRYEGIISIVGFVGGVEAKTSFLDCLSNICTARGVYVGSREMMEDMVAAIEATDLHPVVDKSVFSFDKAREAYQYQWDQKHFGKVVVKID